MIPIPWDWDKCDINQTNRFQINQELNIEWSTMNTDIWVNIFNIFTL